MIPNHFDERVVLVVHMIFRLFLIICVAWAARDVSRFVAALNAIGPQPTALMVLGTGFLMLVVSKWYGIDTSVAGGVIGAAINMLTGQPKKDDHSTTAVVVPTPTHPAGPDEAKG